MELTFMENQSGRQAPTPRERGDRAAELALTCGWTGLAALHVAHGQV